MLQPEAGQDEKAREERAGDGAQSIQGVGEADVAANRGKVAGRHPYGDGEDGAHEERRWQHGQAGEGELAGQHGVSADHGRGQQVGEDEGQAIGDEIGEANASNDAEVGDGQRAHRLAKARHQAPEHGGPAAQPDEKREQDDGEREDGGADDHGQRARPQHLQGHGRRTRDREREQDRAPGER